MLLMETLMKRRSIRQYTDQPVEHEKISRLIAGMLLSPSSRGIRPWEFIVVENRDTLARLSRCKPHGASFLARAPLGIVVMADTSLSDVWVEDASIASVIALLMAEELGLGACWCQIRERSHDSGQPASDQVRSILEIPERFAVESIIAVGYPDEIKPPYDKTSLHTEKVYHDRFGERFPIVEG